MTWLASVRRSVGELRARTVERIAKRQLEEMRRQLAELRAGSAAEARVAATYRDATRDELLRHSLQTRLMTCRRIWRSMPFGRDPEPLSMQPVDFDRDLQQLEQLHPHLFATWRQINLVDNPVEYAARPSSSCSVGLGRTEQPFAGFIAPYLEGRVLDLGCGPHAVPSYLRDYPTRLVSGIDPLEPFEPHPFQFARGFGEFLPWADHAFDVVVNATSLDHCLSLDRVAEEIVRVLRPGGLFLVWEGFIRGSVPYRPSDPDLRPVDQFHLFHFDRPWFEDYFGRSFEIVERVALDDPPWSEASASNYFYALRRRDRQ